MKIAFLLTYISLYSVASFAQPKDRMAYQPMTPEKLIELNRVSGLELSDDGQFVYYAISKVDIESDTKTTNYFKIPVKGGKAKSLPDPKSVLTNSHLSPDGTMILEAEDVKLNKVYGTDHYPNLDKSNMMIYNELNYRHWDKWEDGAYSHVILKSASGDKKEIDLMANEPYDCPTQPFGGGEDFIWSNDGNNILYVTKKKFGTEYTVSTNADIYQYNLASKSTTNLTAYNPGYDTQPAFSSEGQLAFLQMKRDGYESDKNDIVVDIDGKHVNITGHWDGTVSGFKWSNDGKKIYFNAPIMGTVQLFEIDVPKGKSQPSPKQLTSGQFDVNGIVGQAKNTMVVSRRDMNHAPELYTVNLKSGHMTQLTHANDKLYNNTALGKVESRMIKTTDGKDMLTWVIYPPNFDPSRKYPTLLYCQGGPQGALSQFYSYRWNFQLMAANGYIVVAPNRRGMPGYGVEWNEQISKDYGGQNMKDYLSAIDAMAKEPYVDENRLGCVGASYGGYSAFYLSAIHENRFKTFIAHDGIFNWKSMYGTTEELFFVNWDLGGPYWQKKNALAQQSYGPFNPVEHVEKWNAPILIIQGGKDYRVPIGQGLEAFQAAQLQGIESRLLYFPEENHWVLDYQNSLIWHTEFYKWLAQTL
jgi:dipeptidyl aminopeptidase/acylaminoacyl peptidase